MPPDLQGRALRHSARRGEKAPYRIVSMDASPLCLVSVSEIRIVVSLVPLHEQLPRAAGRPRTTSRSLQHPSPPPSLTPAPALASSSASAPDDPSLLPLAPTPRLHLHVRDTSI